jgi:hypothetical protein|tara:strand:- start:255 stop:494 length:240 start_codon:yes stop_codon:yes gene_type:complete
MIVDFNKHTWVHKGNINKVKKLIMDVEEFQRIRIEAMENKIKELKDTLTLDRERYRGIITELEVELDKFREDEQPSKDN